RAFSKTLSCPSFLVDITATSRKLTVAAPRLKAIKSQLPSAHRELRGHVGKSWKRGAACIILILAVAVGCQKQCFLSQSDFQNAQPGGIPLDLECNPSYSIIPPPGSTPSPTTVDDTKREPRYLTLREAVAIALENGNVGVQNGATP